jgi:hypothetical protein
MVRAASLIAVAGTEIASATGINCGAQSCKPGAPEFAQFSITIERGSTVSPDVSTKPKARKYRIAIREAAASGPNFSGHYTVVTWGCGVACQALAILDAKTGEVYFPPELALNAYHVVHEDPLPPPFQYQLDSRLLVLIGSPNDTSNVGVFFYLWEPPHLHLIYSENRRWL